MTQAETTTPKYQAADDLVRYLKPGWDTPVRVVVLGRFVNMTTGEWVYEVRNYDGEQTWSSVREQYLSDLPVPADEQCGCLRNPLGHSRAQHPKKFEY